ncbi:hypothetical protein BZA70DRAFT_196798 [Myxozyma melibiosi]|uniref:C2H2-type domain-containing protein n=1 Tax=Myxozyma melibiosi TaxID=54550 RepID=A0ABR1F2B5_9ASCO
MQSVIQFGSLPPRPKRPRKQHICQYCQASFKRGEHLLRHERSHTAERPFDCAACETSFSRKDLLIRHTRTCAAAAAAAAAKAKSSGASQLPSNTASNLNPSSARSSASASDSEKTNSLLPLSFPALQEKPDSDKAETLDNTFGAAALNTTPAVVNPTAGLDQSKLSLSADGATMFDDLLNNSQTENLSGAAALPNQAMEVTNVDNTQPDNSAANEMLNMETGNDMFANFDISQYVTASSPMNMFSPGTSALLGSLDLIGGDYWVGPLPELDSRKESAPLSHRSDSTGEDEARSFAFNDDWDSSASSPNSGIDTDTPWSDMLTEGIDFDMCDINKVAIFDDTCRANLFNILSAISPHANAPILPTTDQLNTYLIVYKTGYGQQFPLIHSTFCRFSFVRRSGEITIEKMAGAVLMMVMSAIGAVYVSDHEEAKSLCSQCKEYITLMSVGRTIFTDDQYLPLLQAKLLTCMFDAWSGDVEMIESALNDLPFLSRCCAYGVQRRKARDISSWSAWVTREGYHRLYWGIFTFMSNLNLAYGQGMVVRLTDLGLPLPESDQLWFANAEGQFHSLLTELDASLTTDEAIARIFAASSMDSNEVDKADRQMSKFAILVLLHMVMQHLGDTKQVLHFSGVSAMGGDSRGSNSGIELEYIRTVSYEQIDRLIHHLIKCLLKLSNTRGRVSIESMAHIIKIRRCGISVTSFFRGLLSDPCLSEYLDPVIDEFALRTLTRSTQANKAIYLSLPYVRGFIRAEEKPDSIEQVLCFWESMLSLIAWIHGVEAASEREMSVEEQFVVESVSQMIESSTMDLPKVCGLSPQTGASMFTSVKTQGAGQPSVSAQVAHMSHEIFKKDGKWDITKRMALVMERLEKRLR